MANRFGSLLGGNNKDDEQNNRFSSLIQAPAPIHIDESNLMPSHVPSQVPQPNPIVGENLFLTNTFPIRQNDSPFFKGLKGIGNIATSALSAPGEALRQGAIQGGNLLTGHGLQDLPKNTSFINDILPKGASNALGNFQQSHPVIGGLANMAIETAVDPTAYIGSKAIMDAIKMPTGIDLARRIVSDTKLPKYNPLAANPDSKINRYSFTTGEQRAMNALDEGTQTAQNFIRHNDVLAPYPAGTTVKQAFADIKANTNVDIPQLTSNWDKSQSLRTSLTPQELQMGRVSGIIPKLARREGLQPKNGWGSPSVAQSLQQGQLQGRQLPFGPRANTEIPAAGNLGTPMANDAVNPKTQIVSSFKNTKSSIPDKLQNLYRETVNNTQGINRTVKGLGLTGSDNPVVMASNTRNAGGTVSRIIDHGLVDMSGKTIIDKSIKDAFNLQRDQQTPFDEYLFHLHNIDRMREGKPVFGNDVTVVESQKTLANLENSYPNFKEKASVVRQTLDGLLNKWGVESGLVSPELRDTLQNMYKNYVPTYRSLSGVDAITTKTRSAGPAKLINTAIGGEEPLITLRESVPMLINKTVRAARKNEVYQGILGAARANPENGFAKVLEVDTVKEAEYLMNAVSRDGIEGIVSNSDKALSTDPKLGYLLTAMENGKPVKMRINKELYESMDALNKVDDSALGSALQTVKKYATNPFKALITGYNPLFAVRNVSRDIPTAFIQGTENNPFKFVGNLATAAKDMATKNPRYKEFQALGGQGSNFFNVEKGLKPTGLGRGILKKVGSGISALNNATETLPRYGEYLGTLKRGGEGYSNKMQGLYNAAEVTTNFGRHGDLIKSIDAVVPYLNPAFQGIDRAARSLTKPSTYAKALGVITAPTAGIYAINQIVDKENYDQVDNRTKDTYFLIPEKLWGGEAGKFIKIAKAREAGVLFGTLFERIARQVKGDPAAFKGFGTTVGTNAVPANPFESNIASPVLNAKYTNKDFANRDIVPAYMINDKRSPKLQFDAKTSEIAKKIGDSFNLSPKKIDYLITSYTGIVGSLANAKKPTDVITRSFVADAKYNNEIQNNFYDKLDELRRVASDKNITQNVPSKTVTSEEKSYNAMLKVSTQLADIRKSMLKAGNQATIDSLQQKLLDTAKKATK